MSMQVITTKLVIKYTVKSNHEHFHIREVKDNRLDLGKQQARAIGKFPGVTAVSLWFGDKRIGI